MFIRVTGKVDGSAVDVITRVDLDAESRAYGFTLSTMVVERVAHRVIGYNGLLAYYAVATVSDINGHPLFRKRVGDYDLIRQGEEPSIDPHDFMGWLNSKGDQEPVGMARSSRGCPIYQFLTETRKDAGHFTVSPDIIQYITPDGIIHAERAPYWATRFIDRVDHSRDVILAAYARQIMSGIEPII